MCNVKRAVFLTYLLSSVPTLVIADNASDIKALNDAKALLDAQAGKDASEAAAIKAASDLAKAKAAAADLANDLQKSHYDSIAALTKSQVGAQTAQIDALKATFGAPPTVGGDGNISISDTSTGTLLEIKKGSLDATRLLAENLCSRLAAAKVTGAFVAPSDLDAKIQNARMVMREFTALSALVRRQENKDLVGLGTGVSAQVTPAEVLASVSLLQYGAGALQSITKLFRSDYAIGLSSDATRATWLEYFAVDKCPAQIPKAQMEAVVRNQSLDEILGRINEMQEFYTAATSRKSAIQKQIDQLTTRIAALKTDKKDTTATEELLNKQNDAMLKMIPLDAWLPRVQTLITTVSTNPGAFLDAITWNAFGDNANPLKINGMPRLTMVLTTQDGQITETFWLTGKAIYGRSAGELTYRVTMPDGKLVTVGYLTAISTTGKLNIGSSDVANTEDGRRSQIPYP